MLGPRLSILGRPVIYTDVTEEHLGFIVSAENSQADVFIPQTGDVVPKVDYDPAGSPQTWRFIPNEDR